MKRETIGRWDRCTAVDPVRRVLCHFRRDHAGEHEWEPTLWRPSSETSQD